MNGNCCELQLDHPLRHWKVTDPCPCGTPNFGLTCQPSRLDKFQKGSTIVWKKTMMMNISTQSKWIVAFWNECNKPYLHTAHSPNKKNFCAKQVGHNQPHQMNNCDDSWKYVLEQKQNQIDAKKNAKDHEFDTYLRFQCRVALSKIILYAFWPSTNNETPPIELQQKNASRAQLRVRQGGNQN